VDRYLAPDIATAQTLVRTGALAPILQALQARGEVPAFWQPA
jgi:hypothetical protein